MGLGALKAIQEKGRNELLGHIHGVDGDTAALRAILDGQYGSSHECSPYYGMTAFEYAIRYLNGEKIPARVMLPTRWFTAFDDTRKAELTRLVKVDEDGQLPFTPLDIGGQVILSIPDVDKVYGKPWWEDADKTKIKPFTEAQPFKTPAWQ